MFISITFISFLFCLGGEETYFEGENLLGEKYLTLSVQTSSCSRCYVGITMQMGIVSAIVAVPHSSPSPAKMEEHEYSLYITGQRSREAQSIEMLLIVHAKYGCVFLMSIAQF